MSAEKPAEGQPNAQPAANAQPSTQANAQPSIDPKEHEALQKRAAKADKLEKEYAALQERVKSPEFAKEIVANMLGFNKEKDPKAEIDGLSQRASKAEALAISSLLKAHATEAALAAGVDPKRIKTALRNVDLSAAKVNLESGAIENADELFPAAFAALKTDLPEVFVQPAPPPEKGPPGGEKKAPPSPTQQKNEPLTQSNDNNNTFAAWKMQHGASH